MTYDKDFFIKMDIKPEANVNISSENSSILIEHTEQDCGVKIEFAEAKKELIEEFFSTSTIQYIEDSNLLNIEITSFEYQPEKKEKDFLSILNLSQNFVRKVTIFLPKQVEIKAETENGSLKFKQIQGLIKAFSENGALRLIDCLGPCSLETENGKIKTTNCAGTHKLRTENGKIEIFRFDGELTTISENGKTVITEAKGNEISSETENGAIRASKMKFEKVNIVSEQGSIYYEFKTQESGDCIFENIHGRIQLIIPSSVPYHLLLTNDIGSIRLGLEGPYEKFKDERNHQTIEKTNLSGKVEILARNEIGAISVLSDAEQKGTEHTSSKEFNFDFDFDFDDIGKTIEEAMSHVNKNFDPEKIAKKIEKAAEKFEKVSQNIDVEKIKNTVIEGINKFADLAKQYAKENNEKEKPNQEPPAVIQLGYSNRKPEDRDSALKNAISTMKEKLMDEFQQSSLTEPERDTVKKQSRTKILSLLKNGKITVQEAEDLLNAMEIKND